MKMDMMQCNPIKLNLIQSIEQKDAQKNGKFSYRQEVNILRLYLALIIYKIKQHPQICMYYYRSKNK